MSKCIQTTKYPEAAFLVPSVLLPEKDTDMYRWAVVACDQFTSEPEYWNSVEKITKNFKSAFHLMLPELYLEEADVDRRIEVINQTMAQYLTDGTLQETEPCFILVRRSTNDTPVRTGLIMALDLEHYDFHQGSGSLIRATEGTVIERVPPRMKIRRNAALEMPHIMILIDDPERTVIEPAAQHVEQSGAQPLYQTELMMGGGYIRGYKITEPAIWRQTAEALVKLADPQRFCRKYQVAPETPVLLYAVGDGNHSLAAAKCHYEEQKAIYGTDIACRYALVEVVNVHDQGIIFEPIHRVLFGVEEDFLPGLKAFYPNAADFTVNGGENEPDPVFAGAHNTYHTVPYFTADTEGCIYLDRSLHTLSVGALQTYLDYYLSMHPKARVDYIHGSESVMNLGKAPGNMGFVLPAMRKEDLFATVIKNGSLPRKTFSMGEACEKRYYMECRKL